MKMAKKNNNIYWFKELKIKDIPIAGGKGASLGEMSSLMPVPDGFVVSAQAYGRFVKNVQDEIFAILKKLDADDSLRLEAASQEIQEIILKTDMPADIVEDIEKNYSKIDGFVAVRSSATAEDLPTASFAGQQATFLNVKGVDNVVKAVKECWASLFTGRAIYYRVTNKFKHEDVLIAVVVQKMVNSQKAGVLFTVNPVNNNHDEIIIEGAFGLGELVVSGQITPDMYLVDKKKMEIKEKMINEKEVGLFRNAKGDNVKMNIKNPIEQVLTDKEIIELSKLALKIEQHYKKPQDIEWAVGDDKKIYILQSRPITTLK
jgi:pyruvate,water dikinase